MKNLNNKCHSYREAYAIANVIAMIIIFVISIYFINIYISGVIVKILFIIIAFPICVEFEYHYIIKIVNPIVDLFIPKRLKQAEKEWFANCKRQAEAERITKSRAESELKD